VRAFEHLDAPLHVRLRGDAEALKPVPLKPEWNVGIGPIFRGQSIVSRHRSYAPLVSVSAFVALPILYLASGDIGGTIRTAEDMSGDPLGRVLLGLAGVVVLFMAGAVVRGALNTFHPGAIEVNDRGVSYRWRRMRFDQIEEITTGEQVEIVGDRRVMALPASFCPRAAVNAVAHELQRLILETAPKV
jgi:hypothetical protein